MYAIRSYYVSRYEDQQTFAQQLDSSGANWFREVNAGKADIWGIEAELLAEPIENLRVILRIAYIIRSYTTTAASTSM